jgi:hypothetical protein
VEHVGQLVVGAGAEDHATVPVDDHHGVPIVELDVGLQVAVSRDQLGRSEGGHRSSVALVLDIDEPLIAASRLVFREVDTRYT